MRQGNVILKNRKKKLTDLEKNENRKLDRNDKSKLSHLEITILAAVTFSNCDV